MAKVQATYIDIWKISYPIILGSLAQTILGLTDTAFLARVGEAELGASAIAGVFYFLLVMLGVAVGVGSQILIARKAGEGNDREIGKLFDHTLLLLLALSLVLLFCLNFGAPFIFDSFLNSANVKSAAIEFITYRCWGIVFVMIVTSFRSFYVGIATTRIMTYSAILMTVLNVVLAYAFIFGKIGFPKMGIAGAGLASSISEAVTAIYLWIYTYNKKEFKKYELFAFREAKTEIFKSIMNLSFPVMLQHFISMGAWFLFFVFIERMGEHQLAISNVVRSTYMLLMTPMWGFSAAANTMTSNLIGQQKSDEVIPAIKKIATLSFIITSVLILFNLLFPELVLGIVTSDINLIADSLGSYYVVCVAILVFCISLVVFSGVSGTGNTKIAMLMEFVNIFIYLLYAYLCVFVIKTSIEIVWTVEILYWLLMGLLAIIYLNTNHWKKIKL